MCLLEDGISWITHRLSSLGLPIQIKYGTTNRANKYRSILFNVLTFVTMIINYIFMTRLRIGITLVSEASSQNMTLSVNGTTQCPPLYKQCWCFPQLQRQAGLDSCSIETCRRYFHPLVLVWFLFQVCLIRELFTCTGRLSRLFVRTLYILSFAIFLTLTIGIYWSDCFHNDVAVVLHLACGVLGPLGVHHLLHPKERESSTEHDLVTVIIQYRRRVDHRGRAWHQLL